MKTIDNFNFAGKKALIRVDFNVPLDENFKVTDNTRIEAAKPTIEKILKDGGTAVLMSHLGRPKGERNDKYSLRHIVSEVEKVLGKKVIFVDDCVGEVAEKAVAAAPAGSVVLLENLRYHNEEEKGDENFSKQLAKLGDIYVNDAFGTAHRAHASTTIVAKFFPNNKCFGYLLAKEIESIDKVMRTGEKPVTAILGGSKVSSKITIIENILDKVNHLIIGGGMAYTFAKAQGGKVGNSICEDDKLDLALDILAKAKAKGVEVHLPIDVVAADAFDNNAKTQVVPVNAVPDGWEGLDAGPKTLANIKSVLLASKTILWNGPVGVFEMPNFAKGTIGVCEAIANLEGATTIIGGGDSATAAISLGYAEKFSHISTGGGASLEYLEGKVLPGIDSLSNK